MCEPNPRKRKGLLQTIEPGQRPRPGLWQGPSMGRARAKAAPLLCCRAVGVQCRIPPTGRPSGEGPSASLPPNQEAPGLVLQIVHYPHPALVHKSRPLKRVDDELRDMIRQMFGLMYEAKGIGLAANQVALPYRMFVLNLTGDPTQPDEERVFLNPVVSRHKGNAEAEEGCLSLPGLYAQVRRPEAVRLNAYNLAGEEVSLDLEGLFARAVQHEVDHLDGVLFIDRLSPTARMAVADDVHEFELNFQHRRETGEIADDAAIALELARLEELRT